MFNNSDTFEIDLRHYLWLLIRSAWLILLVAVLIAGMALGYARFFVTPQYSSSVQFYVNNDRESYQGYYDASQLTAAAYLAESYMVILRGKPVLNAVLEETGLPYSTGQLRGMIAADTVNETEIFEVTITNPDAEEATLIANAFAQVLPVKIAEVIEGSSVRLVDYAEVSNVRVSPSYKVYALTGAVIGFALSVAAILVKEFMDDGIKSEEYLTYAYAEIPLLAVIPDAQEIKSKGYYKGYKRYYKSKYASEAKRPGEIGGKTV